MAGVDPARLDSPILFRGDAATAYRDPAAVWHDGTLHLFFTLVEAGDDRRPWMHVGHSATADLIDWTPVRRLTPRDRSLNFSSPGNLVRHAGRWVLCLQTYPRPGGQQYATNDARLWTMASDDLLAWDAPELLRVKGPDVPDAAMGRMIDPFLLADKDDPGRWWCLFKQGGVARSWSRDLRTWTFAGRAEAGENACVVVRGGEYVLFHSPENGIGVKRSADLGTWRDDGLITLGQKDWPWARGRLTAGFVLDLTATAAPDPRPDYLLFFHASGPEDERTMFDTHASIGVAWGDDLSRWHWPGEALGRHSG